MRYRKLDVRLWVDAKWKLLTPLQPSGQALFFYLLTNPNTTNIPGLYRAGELAMAEELGWAVEDFRAAFHEVTEHGLVKADFKARVVFIPNAVKFNKPESPNVVRGWASTWDEIPECELKNHAYQGLQDFVKGLGEGYMKAFGEAIDKACTKTMPNQEQEQEQEQEREIIKTSIAGSSSSSHAPQEEIRELYHRILPMGRKVRIWNEGRARLLRARWRENPKHQTLEFWDWYFNYVKKSKFLTGQVSGRDGRPFVVDLEWLLKPQNFAKVVEGKYDE